jgi:hypothetical protein
MTKSAPATVVPGPAAQQVAAVTAEPPYLPSLSPEKGRRDCLSRAYAPTANHPAPSQWPDRQAGRAQERKPT